MQPVPAVKRLGSAAILLAVPALVVAQALDSSLPRRPFFGVALAPGKTIGVAVTSVLPESTAAELGVLAGDLLTAIDGEPMHDAAGIIATMAAHRAGDGVAVDALRRFDMLNDYLRSFWQLVQQFLVASAKPVMALRYE